MCTSVWTVPMIASPSEASSEHDSIFVPIPYYHAGKPAQPTGPLVVDNVTSNSADLTWKVPSNDGGSPLTGYLVEMRPTNRSTWSKVGTVDSNTTNLTVTDLLEGTEYYFRVSAINAEGTGQPLDASDTAKPQKKIGMQIL